MANTLSVLPNLMFICALEPKTLRALFENRFVLDDLKSLGAGVAIAVRDFSEERAQAVRLLNRMGIPVSAWLLLPGREGSWLDGTNVVQTAELYDALLRWSERKGLRWSAVGLAGCLSNGKTAGLDKAARASEAVLYKLIDQAHEDGFGVELFYDPPEPHANKEIKLRFPQSLGQQSRVVERRINLKPNHHVVGYPLSSQIASYSEAVCVSNAQGSLFPSTEAGAQKKSWRDFAQELRAARQKSSSMYVFSLESCAELGFLDRMVTLDWNAETPGSVRRGNSSMRKIRAGLQRMPWLGIAALISLISGALLIVGKKKR